MEYRIIRKKGDVDKRESYLSKEVGTLAANPTSDNIPFVLVTRKSTSTPSQHMKNTSEDIKTMETQQKLTPMNSQTSTCLWEDSLAKLSASLVKGEDSKIREELYSLKSRGYLKASSRGCLSLRTSKDFSTMTAEKHLPQSSRRLMNWGMMQNGRFLTANTSASHRIGKECSLSDILEEHPDPKYFLSEKNQKKIIGELGEI